MPDIQQHLIGAGAAIELFLSEPRTRRPKGAMLFVHGNQGGTLLGAREMVDNGTLANISARLGIVAASVSQPGFGASEGPADFCGPRTQDAVHEALDFLRDDLDDEDPVVLYGLSRGAVASAMVASEDAGLAGLILVAGNYDLAATYKTGWSGLRGVIEGEAGTTDADFSARSPLRHAHRILADTLLVHGRQDDRAPFEQAEQMAGALRKAGTTVSLEAFDCGHRIPREFTRAAIRPFLTRIFASTL